MVVTRFIGEIHSALDSSLFDPDSQFLERLMLNSSNLLSSKIGQLVLLYSNFGGLLGVQDVNIVEKMCTKYGLQVVHKEEELATDLEDKNKMYGVRKPWKRVDGGAQRPMDALELCKKDERIQLYIIASTK